MASDETVRLQRDHATARVRELRAQSAVEGAQESVAVTRAALEAADVEPIDAGLPTNPMEAAVELERRSYELTSDPRTEMAA